MMYAEQVRRLQIMIEEELDEALARQARAERTSKAALIRRYVGERLRPAPPLERDPLWGFFGSVEGDARDSASVDDIVYGPCRRA
jgi:Ribbon-helix-helix protein, copG family